MQRKDKQIHSPHPEDRAYNINLVHNGASTNSREKSKKNVSSPLLDGLDFRKRSKPSGYYVSTNTGNNLVDNENSP